MDIKDLIQGMDYEFRVCAVNSEGEGPFSKPSDSFTTKNKYIGNKYASERASYT